MKGLLARAVLTRATLRTRRAALDRAAEQRAAREAAITAIDFTKYGDEQPPRRSRRSKRDLLAVVDQLLPEGEKQ